MIDPMDSASPSTELAQRLYRKNTDLENELRRSAQAKVPSDPNIWLQMRENYEAIILEDHDFADRHSVESTLWQLHYRRIEEFRSHINSASSTRNSSSSPAGKNQARPERIKKIRSAFKSFLSEATGFYHDLIQKIRAKYGLPLGYFPESSEGRVSIEKDEKRSAEIKKGLQSCHRCLIYLGDLSRYKGLYGEGDAVNRDFAASSAYYTQAASLWPISGNPHHQLAILASYHNDELVAIYRYFRSLAVDSPFPTARENLIIAFEKNRQRHSQLPRNVKSSSVKSAAQVNGRGRSRDSKVLVTDAKTESMPKAEQLSVTEVFKYFSTRFLRLNGILFTRTSLETFGELFQSVISDLRELLASGAEEELNFGSSLTENGLLVVRLISIIIFTVHNVRRETEGQSYAEILQRSLLLQHAFTVAFEFTGHIVKRCLQLRNSMSSYLLPGILVFIEWLACHPDIASGDEGEDKLAAPRSFFWNQFVALMNKILVSGLVSVDTEGDEACFSQMTRYDDEEASSTLALWEDFELRGFSPLAPAQLILDFSTQHPVYGGLKEERIRMQRIIAAGKVLMNVVKVEYQSMYFDFRSKKFAIGNESLTFENVGEGAFPGIPSSLKKTVAVENPVDCAIQAELQGVGNDTEEEEEEIVFKPTVTDKYLNGSASSAYETKSLVQNPMSNQISYVDLVSSSQSLIARTVPDTYLNGSSYSNLVHHPMQDVSVSTSERKQEELLSNGFQNLRFSEQGYGAFIGPYNNTFHSPVTLPFSTPTNSSTTIAPLVPGPAFDANGLNTFHSTPVMLPFSTPANSSTTIAPLVPAPAFDANGLNTFHSTPVTLPFSTPANSSTTIPLVPASAFDAIIPSNLDSVLPSGTNFDGVSWKLGSVAPASTKKKPVSRPLRHNGPPPGFKPVPAKQPDDPSPKDDSILSDDYSWLDGYKAPVNRSTMNGNPSSKVPQMLLDPIANHNNFLNPMGFPSNGISDSNGWTNYQLSENSKLYPEQERYRAQWPGGYYV